MSNYDRVFGVKYRRFTDSDEPETEQYDAKIEEMYFDGGGGTIEITMETEDGFLSIGVPVRARLDFNEFKYSLPEIDL